MSPIEARRAVGQPDIVFALENSIQWHAEQGRPHSESVDRDALAEIERLRTALRAVRACTDPAWAAQIISDALRETP
jgi:hypothetical protein